MIGIRKVLVVAVLAFLSSHAMGMYDVKQGRFMQQDPLGVTPNPSKPNKFKPAWQYADGMNVYGYVGNAPTTKIDPYGLKKKKRCACFCINHVTYRWRKSSVGDQPFVGGYMLMKIHGYWKDWSLKGVDGRAEAHWWEWFSDIPTNNKKKYEDEHGNPLSTYTWHDLMHKRLPPKYKSSYRLMNDVPLEYTDEPGINCAPGMGTKSFEARILMAAKSHPMCPCPKRGLYTRAAYIKYDVTWHGVGSLFVNDHEFVGYERVSGSPWPTRNQIDNAFTFSF